MQQQPVMQPVVMQQQPVTNMNCYKCGQTFGIPMGAPGTVITGCTKNSSLFRYFHTTRSIVLLPLCVYIPSCLFHYCCVSNYYVCKLVACAFCRAPQQCQFPFAANQQQGFVQPQQQRFVQPQQQPGSVVQSQQQPGSVVQANMTNVTNDAAGVAHDAADVVHDAAHALGVITVSDASKAQFNAMLDQKLGLFDDRWDAVTSTNEEIKSLFTLELLVRYYWTGSFFKDFVDFIKESHPLFGICYAHPLHSISHKGHLLYNITIIIISLYMSNVFLCIVYRTSCYFSVWYLYVLFFHVRHAS